MLGNAKVCPTIAVTDLTAARKFYEETLGLTVSQELENEHAVLYGDGESTLQVYESGNAGTNAATYATWEVDDIAGVVGALRDKGVTFEHYADMPGVELDGDIHRWGDEQAAWFKDPDGNVLCLHAQD